MSDLIARIAAGDETAMRALYESLAHSITIFIRGWLRDPSEASDIVHETMLVVWRDAAKFEGRSSLKSWIFGIAKNKALERNRAGARLETHDDVIPEDVSDDGDDPHTALDALEDAKAVRECISTLSPAHQRAVHLCFFDDLSYAEIAEIEACPVGTVKTRIMHAKKLLLRCVTAKSKEVKSVNN